MTELLLRVRWLACELSLLCCPSADALAQIVREKPERPLARLAQLLSPETYLAQPTGDAAATAAGDAAGDAAESAAEGVPPAVVL